MKIGFIITYYGKWPPYYELWARSLRANPQFSFLVVTDLPAPDFVPDNLRIVSMSRAELEARVTDLLGLPFKLRNFHKCCDLRPLYGLIFSDLVSDWKYWGYCDMDLVFGDLTPLYEAAERGTHMLISPWNFTAGHCTLVRNQTEANRAFFQLEGFRERMASPDYAYCEEGAFAYLAAVTLRMSFLHTPDVRQEWLKPKCFLGATFAPPCRLSGAEQWDVFAVLCEEGRTRVLDGAGNLHEVLYFHFMGAKSPQYWKRFQAPGTFPFSFLPHGYQPGLTSLAELHAPRTRMLSSLARTRSLAYMNLHRLTPPPVRRGLKRALAKLRGISRT